MDVEPGGELDIEFGRNHRRHQIDVAKASFSDGLQRIEQRARAAGLKRLFVLTTRTAHWFIKRGFVAGSVDELPQTKQHLYNWQRKSQVLFKPLS